MIIIYHIYYHPLGPPTACTDLMVDSRTNTTVVVTWRRPTVTGRPDYFYRVEVSEVDLSDPRVNAFNEHNSNLVNRNIQPTYTVSPLVPHTFYVIRVSVHNGVSDQDPDGHLRFCEVVVMTLEGGKKTSQAVMQCIEGGICTAFTIIQLIIQLRISLLSKLQISVF